jgi:hypothetical protein
MRKSHFNDEFCVVGAHRLCSNEEKRVLVRCFLNDAQHSRALTLCKVPLNCVSHFSHSYDERHYAQRHYGDCSYAECHYAECRYAECPFLSVIITKGIMLSVFMLNVIILNFVAPLRRLSV